MAVPLYSASPINGNAPNSAYPASPSTFAMRYTPASALEDQLSAAATTPPALTPGTSRSTTPSPDTTNSAQQANTNAHTSNDISPTSTPAKALLTQTTSHQQQSTTQPSLTKLSIPTTSPTIHAQPTILSPYAPSPLSTVPSYTHSRHASSISGISTYSNSTYISPSPSHYPSAYPHIHSAASASISTTPFHTHPYRDLSNPPGYIQNTRESFEDRIISQDPEEQSFLVSPIGSSGRSHHKSRASFGGGLLDGNYGPAGTERGEGDGELGRLWETASEWAKAAAKKLGDGEKEVFRVLSGER